MIKLKSLLITILIYIQFNHTADNCTQTGYLILPFWPFHHKNDEEKNPAAKKEELLWRK